MKKIFLVIAVAIAVVVFLGIIAGIVLTFVHREEPDHIVLELQLNKKFVEMKPDDPISRIFMKDFVSFRDLIEGLERAARDPKVDGLVACLSHVRLGFAQLQELRDTIIDFRKSGRFAVCYADTFGEFSNAMGSYYLATAFDDIYVQPSGDLCLTGLIIESYFLKNTLDKLGLKPLMDHRYEYKNALNTFTEKAYTIPHREAVSRIMYSLYNQIVNAISEMRSLDVADVKKYIDAAPLSASEAFKLKLVDGLMYRSEVYESIKDRVKTEPHYLYLSKYREKTDTIYGKGEKIALIVGSGSVNRGESSFNPLDGSMSMGSDDMCRAFRHIRKDDEIKAVIFRVDSPGGSYVASDSIWHAVQEVRKAGKPVIVTMGNVAGSGGYFVAMNADKIVAEPGTITGSIGVLGGKFMTREFWEKFGVTWDEVHTNKSSTMWTGTHEYTPEQWSRIQDWLDRIYKDFTTKVSEGRNLPLETVLEIAKGRIWSGEDAKRLGLVDALGGMKTALTLAKEAAGIPLESDVELVVFPRARGFFQRFREADNSEKTALTSIIRLVLEELRPLYALISQMGFHEESPGLKVPPDVQDIPFIPGD